MHLIAQSSEGTRHNKQLIKTNTAPVNEGGGCIPKSLLNVSVIPIQKYTDLYGVSSRYNEDGEKQIMEHLEQRKKVKHLDRIMAIGSRGDLLWQM